MEGGRDYRRECLLESPEGREYRWREYRRECRRREGGPSTRSGHGVARNTLLLRVAHKALILRQSDNVVFSRPY